MYTKYVYIIHIKIQKYILKIYIEDIYIDIYIEFDTM